MRFAHGTRTPNLATEERTVHITAGAVALEGTLGIPSTLVRTPGAVLFAHGSGSSRFSPRNRYVAEILREAGLATLLLDLLTPAEEQVDLRTRQLRFDIDLLARRLVQAISWMQCYPTTAGSPIGLFGASTGAGAALLTVEAPTLLIVGGRDDVVIDLNKQAMRAMPRVTRLDVIPGATHLFEEPGALEQVADRARAWFARYLSQTSSEEMEKQR